MFDKIFQRAVLISLGVHLILMCGVTVVIGPRILGRPERLDVAFLGAIAEEHFSLQSVDAIPGPVFQSGMIKRVVIDRQVPSWQLRSDLSEGSQIVFERARRTRDPLARTQREKFFTVSLQKQNVRKERGVRNLEPVFTIQGPAHERQLVFTPDIQEVTLPREMISSRDIDVMFKFWISEGGWVQQVVPIHSSGYIEADLSVARYLRSCRFTPLDKRSHDKMRWGIAYFPASRLTL